MLNSLGSTVGFDKGFSYFGLIRIRRWLSFVI